jgi:hypothetical protein
MNCPAQNVLRQIESVLKFVEKGRGSDPAMMNESLGEKPMHHIRKEATSRWPGYYGFTRMARSNP